MVYIYIGVGGFFGAISRYAIGNLVNQTLGNPFPAGTFLANLIGCFLLGFIMTLSLERLVMSPNVRMGIATGFLGGLTTFSTYTYEALTLSTRGLWWMAVWYTVLSVLVGITAVWLGAVAARALTTLSQKLAQQSWTAQEEPGD